MLLRCLPLFKLYYVRDAGSSLHLFRLLHTSFVFACQVVLVCACACVYEYVYVYYWLGVCM